MSERMEALQQYVSDMLAVERAILQSIEDQAEDDVFDPLPDARRLVSRIETTARGHVTGLEQQLSSLGRDAGSPVKEAVTSVLGAAAGLVDKARSNLPSKMLRDKYTSLSMAAIGYTMLHTTGLALHDRATAELAVRHLKNITPLITEISEIIPQVVAYDLRDESEVVDASVIEDAVRNTQEAWASDHIHTGHVHHR